MTPKLLKNGAPGEIRTPDRSVRSRVLKTPYVTVFIPYYPSAAGNIFGRLCTLSACFLAIHPLFITQSLRASEAAT